jgi:hypothetical protein
VLILMSKVVTAVANVASNNPNPAVTSQVQDLLFILCELLNYRFASGNTQLTLRSHLIQAAHNALGAQHVQQNVELYWAIEQVFT